MSKTVVLELVISAELDAEIDEIARVGGFSRSEVLRRGLSVLKAFKTEKASGRRHLGFTSDPRQLDVEIVNVL